MREVTRRLLSDFGVLELGYDFMGYVVLGKQGISFHHLIIPRRLSKKYGISDGYLYWNGSILVQNTSHDYLHTIENYDLDRFDYISLEMIDMHSIGCIGLDNLKKIRDCLVGFEREYSGCKTKKGKEIIKDDFVYKRVLTKKM